MYETAEEIESAIAALEAQRAVLGDAVVGTAIKPLHELLAARRAQSTVGQLLKTVSVLFMDVAGSTRLSEQLDAEDVHAVMDSALLRMTSLVHAHDGKVLQYAGDSLLAVFGADKALEDDAERAVRAGLAIIAEAPRLAAEFRARYGLEGFAIRVGINTGPVLLGGGVDAEASIRGLPVNIAARMEQTAPPGGLRISHETYRHVRGIFDVGQQPPIEVKGITRPVRSYLVLGAKPRAFRATNRGVEGVEVPLVGREAELARIQQIFQTGYQHKRSSIVTVVGEPGIGKSRIAFEFIHWLELLHDPVKLFVGRPRPYGNNVPYGLLRDMLAWRFGILDSDSQAVVQAKLARSLEEVLGMRAGEYTALIGQLMGFDYTTDPHIEAILNEGKQIRDRAFHALALYFQLLHQQSGAPIVLLLDDLHWADEGSLGFVDYVAQACRDLPITIVCLTRPTLYERRPLWGDGQGVQYHRIDLKPLNAQGTSELIEALLFRFETVPAALLDLLAGGTDGNPYFVEELVAMLIDDGVIVTDSEPWRVINDKLHEVKLPTTLAGVLEARIDSLQISEKTALQHASVIGFVFWDEPLARISSNAVDALEDLLRRELTYSRHPSGFDGTREFAFKHHVLHQVAYMSVLKRSRREQHRLVADWLVARCGDRATEYFGLIADHYERAGDNINAAVYLRKAGDDAARSYVNQTALDYFDRALAIIPPEDTKSRFDLLSARATIFSHLGQRAEQEATVVALEQLAEELNNDMARARAGRQRSLLALNTNDFAGAVAAAAQGVARAEAAGTPEVALLAETYWAQALRYQADYENARVHTERALALARKCSDRRAEANVLLDLGVLALQQNDYVTARSHYQGAREIARVTGNRSTEAGAINALADIEWQLGNYAAAFELFQVALSICVEIGLRRGACMVLENLAGVSLDNGAVAESINLLEQANVIANDIKDRNLQASLLCYRGHTLSACGDWDAATDCYRDSAAIFREIGRPNMPSEPLAGLARIALARRDIEGAMTAIVQIIDHLDAGGSLSGTLNPLLIYLTCHQVLAAAANARSEEFLHRAHEQMMQQAALLDDAERASFFQRVPTHRAIITACEASRGRALETPSHTARA